jgi:nucleotide-binding universal stress UspA family protein
MAEILVGVDGSDGAHDALTFAVDEAGYRTAAGGDTTVTALMAWGYLDQHHADGSTDFDPKYDETKALEAARAAVQAAGIDRGDVTVVPKVANDLPATALISASEGADLLVVGSRGLGGFKGLLLGSVSDRCLSRSHCPIVVVPPDAGGRPTAGTVVVGVDSSAGSRAALRWAIDEGRIRGAKVVALHAWTTPFMGGEPMATAGLNPDVFADSANQILDEALDAVVTEGDTRPEPVLLFAGAADSLLQAANDADVIVVGGRPPEGLNRVLLGSTARQVIHHSPCPVVVVPG